jgi:radical SAM protein with 4Fe4S-binding SPASM domain
MHERIVNYIKNQKADLFNTIAIETSEYCNRKCSFCPNSVYNQNKNLMTEELLNRIILQLESINYTGTIAFHQYNEPLIDERLDEFIIFTKNILPKASLMISTNGDYLNYERWVNLRRRGLDYAIISQYDGKVNPNIESILNLLTETERNSFIIKIRGDFNLFRTRGGHINKEKIPQKPLTENCLRPFSQLVIRYSGIATLCCEDYLCDVKIGNAFNETIEEIWNSKTLNKIRNNLIENKRENICLKCNTTYLNSIESCDWIGESRKFDFIDI